MSALAKGLVSVAAIVAAAGVGLWAGQTDLLKLPLSLAAAMTEERPEGTGPVIYYRAPPDKPLYSLTPRTTDGGQVYVAVHASEDVSFDPAPKKSESVANAEPTSSGRKIKFYRNPMGLPDTSPTPKKDSMEMDYIPVYEGEGEGNTTVKLTAGKVQRIGVKTEPAARRVLTEPVRAPGSIQLDERRIAVISLRAESFIDSVEDITTGGEVRKGQPLFRFYSPAITAAGAQYLSAPLAPGSAQRLLNYAVPQQILTDIERTRQVPTSITWTAPREGIVLERNVVAGMRVMPGDVLFRIADHTFVWAMVDVAERDLAAVHEGQTVRVRVRSYPDRTFPGTVALVYPHLNPATRTVPVRIELANPEMLLKPDMYAEAEIETGSNDPVLEVPDSAVIDSGDRQIVLVDKGDGRFEPRAVQLGRHGAGYVEIRDGLTDGESVVVSANFLIDAESNLKSALKSLSAAETHR
jgi:membrane fusion protein, copper/silver efflux system